MTSNELVDVTKYISQDEKDYAEYVGCGPAHRSPPNSSPRPPGTPPNKRMKMAQSHNEDSLEKVEVVEEPRSISNDVFACSQSSDSDLYLTCDQGCSEEKEIKPQEEKREKTLQKGEENEKKLSNFKEGNADERSNQTAHGDSDEDDAQILEGMVNEMEGTSVRTDAQMKVSATMSNLPESEQKLSPDLFSDDPSQRQCTDIDKESPKMTIVENSQQFPIDFQTIFCEIVEDSKEILKKDSVVEDLSRLLNSIDRKSPAHSSNGTICTSNGNVTKINKTALDKTSFRKLSPARSSTASMTPPKRRFSYKDQLAKQVESFSNNNLVFEPNFGKCDQKRNYRYCEIPGFNEATNCLRHATRSGPSVLLSQPWREYDPATNENNSAYMYCKKTMEFFLKDRDSGYHLFEGFLHDMWGYSTKEYVELPALERFYRLTAKKVGEEAVMETFRRLVRLAQKAEDVLPKRIYRLVGDVESATFTHEQCASLVAQMFFNYDRREPMFFSIMKSFHPLAVEKLKFLFAYIDKMATDPPKGVVSFRRVKMSDDDFEKAWKTRCDFPLPSVKFLEEMSIEETALCTQVDFANKYLGGGVLTNGAVQEEIRFLQCPEMMIGMLLVEKMEAREAVSIVGAYVFSSYSGYGSRLRIDKQDTTLKWKPLEPKHARQNEPLFRDEFGRLRTETIAIDACQYETGIKGYQRQMANSYILREIKKAYIGFSCQTKDFQDIPIVSGWWGCGCFHGNKPLKFLIQLIAAGLANRPLHISTFGDGETARLCKNFLGMLRQNNISLGCLFFMIKNAVTRVPDKVIDQFIFDDICMQMNKTNRSNLK